MKSLLFAICSLQILLPMAACGQAWPTFYQRERFWTLQDGRRFKGMMVAVNPEKAKFMTATGLVKVPIRNLSQKEGERALRAWPQDFGKLSDLPITGTDSEEQDAFFGQFPVRRLLWQMGEIPLPKLSHPPKFTSLPMLYHVPVTKDTRSKLPLIVHLHGTGGLGPNINNILFKDANGVAKLYFDKQLQSASPCCLLFPQALKIGGWGWNSLDEAPHIQQFLASAITLLVREPNSRIDPSRIYIVGLSMGGHGVMHAMGHFADYYAAGISVSYADTPELFKPYTVRKNNFWMVLNREDEGNSEVEAKIFQKGYREMGGEFRLTIEDGKGHNTWSKFLGGREYRTWLFNRRLEQW